MRPIFSRETVVDRRQPHIRWGAVIAGSVLALGLWTLFNLLFIGGALTAIDPDELDRARSYGIGTGIGSVLAPLLAMFIGGLVAGRIASHYDRKVTAGHGALVWAVTSVVGLVLMASVVGSFFDKRAHHGHGMGMGEGAPPPGHSMWMGAGAPSPGHSMGMGAPPPGHSMGMTDYVDDQVRLLNLHLKSVSAPTISTNDFLDASRYAAGDGKGINKDVFVSRLDANTKLSRPEAEAALAALGDGAPDVIFAAHQLARHRHQAMEAAEDTGNALLAAGVGLFLCLATTIAGALIGSGAFATRRETVHRHTTAPYPVTTDTNVYRDPLE